jgi:long-chain acyl-CoA synthetase
MAGSGGDSAAEEADALWARRFWTEGYRADVPACILPELEGWSSVDELFADDARRFAERVGFVSLGSELTYGRALAEAEAFGGWLQEVGVRPGDRVALMMPNCLQYPVALFGVLFAGGVVVNVNPLYTPSELRHQLTDSGAVVLVAADLVSATLNEGLVGTSVRHVLLTGLGDMTPWPKRWVLNTLANRKGGAQAVGRVQTERWLRALVIGGAIGLRRVKRAPGDLAFLQYTGGTSGVAKGAMLSHRNILANVLQGRAWVMRQIPEAQVVGNVTLLPLYHIFSLTANLLMFTGIGGRNVLIVDPRDGGRVNWVLKRERFAGMAGLNTLFAGLLATPAFRQRDFSDLKLTIAGGMATQAAIAEDWQSVTGAPLVEGYGLTECAPIVCIGHVDLDQPATMGFDGTVGRPVPSTEVRMRRADGGWCGIEEPGELCVRGPQVMQGYWNRPEETARVLSADGWLSTGDVGVMQADGRVRLVDRIKDMILVSGFNVYPSEIEDVVAAHPLVAEVAALGVPDPVKGERVKIVVVPRSDALTAEILVAHCRTRLTGYKVPRIVEFRTEPLPRTAVGKLLRRMLAEG